MFLMYQAETKQPQRPFSGLAL